MRGQHVVKVGIYISTSSSVLKYPGGQAPGPWPARPLRHRPSIILLRGRHARAQPHRPAQIGHAHLGHARPDSTMASVSMPRWPMRNTLPATSPRPTPKAMPYFAPASCTRSVPLQPSGTFTAVTVSEQRSARPQRASSPRPPPRGARLRPAGGGGRRHFPAPRPPEGRWHAPARDQPDGGGIGIAAARIGRQHVLEIKEGARQLRGFHRGDGLGADAQDRQPAGSMKPFWLPATAISTPQPAKSNGIEAMEDTPSTNSMRHALPRPSPGGCRRCRTGRRSRFRCAWPAPP
jgi:hypothetical protein